MNMTTTTLSDAAEITGVQFLAHLDRSVALPVISDRPCIQGDVSILPTERPPAKTPMPTSVAVVRGEVGGNTHSLHADGPCFWDASRGEGLLLGVLTVPRGSRALLTHVEHGGFLIAAGTYDIGRQREYAGEWRQVAD